MIVRNQEIGVKPGRRARVRPKLFEGNRALRHASGVLDQQHVAGHQVRTRDAGELVVGKIPGFHAEDHTDWTALHMTLAESRMQLDIGKEALGILGVVAKDIRAELHFALRFSYALAHFQSHRVRQLIDPLVHQRGGLGDDDRSFCVGLEFPGLEALFGCRQLLFELLVGQFVEFLEELAGGGVETLISHDLLLFPLLSWDCPV